MIHCMTSHVEITNNVQDFMIQDHRAHNIVLHKGEKVVC
jgi:hypothetical protein